MTSADPRPEAVFVYGLNDWTEPYVALIESLGTSITAYVDSEQAGSNFRGAKVLDPAAFVERYGARGAEPVVILSRSADGLQPNFEAGVTLLANELGCRRRLLHPAFLKRYISPLFPFGHALSAIRVPATLCWAACWRSFWAAVWPPRSPNSTSPSSSCGRPVPST